MGAEMALVGNTLLWNSGEGFALLFLQTLQVAAPQLAISVKAKSWSQTLCYSFLQPSLAARSFTLQSRQTEGEAQVKTFPCPCSTAEAQRHQWPECRAGEMLAEQAAGKGQRAKNTWELFQNLALTWQLVSIIVLSSPMQNDSVSNLVDTAISVSTVSQDMGASSWV